MAHFAVLSPLQSPYSNYRMNISLQHRDVRETCSVLILFPDPHEGLLKDSEIPVCLALLLKNVHILFNHVCSHGFFPHLLLKLVIVLEIFASEGINLWCEKSSPQSQIKIVWRCLASF